MAHDTVHAATGSQIVPVWQTIGEGYRAAAHTATAAGPLILALAAVATGGMRLVALLVEMSTPAALDPSYRSPALAVVGMTFYGVIIAMVAIASHRLVLNGERPHARLLLRFGARGLRYSLMVASYLVMTFVIAVAFGLAAGVAVAAATDETLEGIGRDIGFYSATILWPCCMLISIPYIIVALPMIAADDARWPVGRALRASKRNRVRLIIIWLGNVLPLTAFWFAILVLAEAILGAAKPPDLHRWLIDIANLAAVAALAAASSAVYRRLIGRDDADVVSVFD